MTRALAIAFCIAAVAGSAHAQASSRSGSAGREAFPQNPNWIHPPEAPEVFGAVAAMKQKKWRRAIDLLDGVLEQKPDDLEALYYRGISHREMAKFKALAYFRHYGKGIDDFNLILARDSTYRDVLYQLAQFARVKLTVLNILRDPIRYEDAIDLMHRQVRLRPDAEEHQFHLYSLYRRLLNNRSRESARKWLEGDHSEWATLFKAELSRREGQHIDAERILFQLLENARFVPRQPILLSLARMHYASAEPDAGEAFIKEAVEAIERPIHAAFLFEDVKYIVSEEEVEDYVRRSTAQEYIDYFRAFWTRRDPLPASDINLRLAEHYRRLMVAETHYVFDSYKLWFDNPDEVGELRFPASYELDGEFNDKGHVYIRLGEPSDRIVTLGGMNTAPNESWRYAGLDFDFHFVVDEDGGPSNWRIAPALTDALMLNDRMEWGGVYVQMARASMHGDEPSAYFDIVQGRQKMAEQSREAVARGLTMDRHTWSSDVEPLPFPLVWASFRRADNQALLTTYYALPLGAIASRVEGDSLRIEVGAAVHDYSWNPIGREMNVVRQPRPSDPGAIGVQGIQFLVRPDSYHVAVHMRPQNSSLVGGYRFDVGVPSYSRGGLSASDLLLAYRVRPPGTSLSDVQVNPSGRFKREHLAHVYVEIYDLTFGEGDLTSYTVDVVLTPSGKGPLLRRLFGRSRAGLTLTTEHEGTAASPIETAEIDIRDVQPGRYLITLKVTDRHTGAAVERSREMEIIE